MNRYRFEDLKVGLTASFDASVTEEMLDAFANISGDTNPLHVDGDYAASRGFDGRVAYGLLTSSFYSTLAGVHLPGEFCLLNSIDVRFRRPVYAGDGLTVRGEVVFLHEATRVAKVKARISNQRGETVSTATIQFQVRER